MASLRIVTWNCRRGPLQRKLDAIARLEADITVLTEAPRPKTPLPHTAWFGEGTLGVLVIGSEGLSIVGASNGAGCVHHVQFFGRATLDLLAVWTWPPPSYLGAFTAGLQRHASAVRPDRLVVAGDFNGGPQFDRPRSRKRWRSAFDELEKLGLASAYHHSRGQSHGAESDATHWHRSDEAQRHHIDYVFAPKHWIAQSASVSVGAFGDWHMFSDHAPVSLTIDPPRPV